MLNAEQSYPHLALYSNRLMNAPDTNIQEVLETEQDWTKAFLTGDLATLEKLMDEDYQQIQSDGSVKNKSEVLATFDSGERAWDIAESDEYVVQRYGDVAVLTGRWRGKGVNHGEAFDYAARFVSVYVKRPEGWRMVSDQSTPITKNSEGDSSG